MRYTHVMAWICSAGLIVAEAGTTFGQNYPNKPIRMVTSETGGASDVVSRLIAPGLSENLGQPVIVDDRGTNIAGDIVAKAPPDGYTLLLFGSALWTLPLIRKNMPYDAVTDFAPITLVASAPTILVVHPSVPVTSVRELIALAKAKPGELNYAGGACGITQPHCGGTVQGHGGCQFRTNSLQGQRNRRQRTGRRSRTAIVQSCHRGHAACQSGQIESAGGYQRTTDRGGPRTADDSGLGPAGL